MPTATQRVLIFNIVNDPAATHGAREFTREFDEGTIRFFDLVARRCERMIDFGGCIECTALHVVSRGAEEYALEPNFFAHDLLMRAVAARPVLAPSMHLFHHAIGQRDEDAWLYANAHAGSDASLYRAIEHGSVIIGASATTIWLRDAVAELRDVGVDSRPLLKIDLDGASTRWCR